MLADIIALFAHPGVMTYLTARSEIDRIRKGYKPHTVHAEAPYDGQKIMLLALYQKGELRPDTVRLLQSAKQQGLYVLAVNTLRLSDPAALGDLVDCYIERPNYGRDFGSYKLGFQHFFKSGWHQSCPRLLLLNDSVFYSHDRLDDFIAEMMDSDVEALGSTENYEISHHLGSFCIAIGAPVLRHPAFRSYWKKYRLTDVRPVVIRRGEMGLSRALMRCVSSSSQMQALYNSRRYSALLQDADDNTLDELIRLNRSGDLTPAKRFTFADQFESFSDEFTIDAFQDAELSFDKIAVEDLGRRRLYVDSYSGLKSAISEIVRHSGNRELEGVRQTVVANLLDNFRQHSQIHQNAAILVKMGLPIVKLDGVYRGMFSMADVARILGLLRKDEARELEDILMSRPYGGDVLIGWRRAAFMRGLI